MFNPDKFAKTLFLAACVTGVASVEANAADAAQKHVLLTSVPVNTMTPVVFQSVSAFAKEQAMSAKDLMARWEPVIKEAAKRFKVSENWIRAVMRVESGGRTMLAENKPITSDSGAMGIMQVMPETYQDMRQLHGLGADPYDPRDNVLAGAAYLHWLEGKYGYPEMFAAYNGGPEAVDDFLAHGTKLPKETSNYVDAVAKILGGGAKLSRQASLTRPDGSAIAIDAASVESLRAALPNEYAPSVQTVIRMGNVNQGVREDLATAASIIRKHGGKV